MFIADSSASIQLTNGGFRVEQSGLFRDDTGGTSHVGFSSTSSNANAIVTGNGSVWRAPNSISIGTAGFQNRLLVEAGGKVAASAAIIGGSGGNSNRLTLTGNGATFEATNGLTLAGSQNEFLIQTGGVFNGSQISASGAGAMISIVGPGATAIATQISLSGAQARLQVAGGAGLFTSNGVLNTSGGLTTISDEGTLWKMSGSLSVTAPAPSGATNRVRISGHAAVVTPSLSLSSSSVTRGALLAVESGKLIVTNVAGTAGMTVNGTLELNRGLLRADKLIASSVTLSALRLRAGTAEWLACDLAAGIPLKIGDGTNLATLNLLGGTNICRSGLEVSQHGKLTGRGTIAGVVTNRGLLWPSSLLIIQSNLVLDSTSELAFTIAGPPGSPQNSTLSVTGVVQCAGQLRLIVAPGATPSSGQSFVLVQCADVMSGFANITFGQRVVTADRLASFRVTTTGTAVVADNFQSEDLDGDGIQDSWAMAHFGFSPLLPGTGTNDLSGDWDGDGLNNRNEFLAGTDPNDSSSRLEVQSQRAPQGGMEVRFPFMPDRVYRMRVSDDLSLWTELDVEELLFDSDGMAVWSDAGATANGQRYYQLRVD